MTPELQHLARFQHEEADVDLRLQCFVLPRDADGRIASGRIDAHPDAWLLPGEMMGLDEDPADAARRVWETYFVSEAPDLSLRSVESWPSEGPGGKWYLAFVFEGTVDPDDLEGTPDTLELAFFDPDEPPSPFGFDHGSVWERVTGTRAGLM